MSLRLSTYSGVQSVGVLGGKLIQRIVSSVMADRCGFCTSRFASSRYGGKMPEGRSIPMSEVQAALYHAKEAVAFLEAIRDGADLSVAYPDGTFLRLVELRDFFLGLHHELYGYEACWVRDDGGRHCRKPKGHEGLHSFA